MMAHRGYRRRDCRQLLQRRASARSYRRYLRIEETSASSPMMRAFKTMNKTHGRSRDAVARCFAAASSSSRVIASGFAVGNRTWRPQRIRRGSPTVKFVSPEAQCEDPHQSLDQHGGLLSGLPATGHAMPTPVPTQSALLL